MGKFEQQIVQNQQEDTVRRELRHFLSLVKKGNTECLEMLFNKQYLYKDYIWDDVLDHRFKLLDSVQIFKSLSGYIQGEKNQIFGKTSGKLGVKRKTAIEKYGYSNRNLCHYLRLCYVGAVFFSSGNYTVNLSDSEIYSALMTIKCHPETIDLLAVEYLIATWAQKLKDSFENRGINYTFQEDVADELLNRNYLKFLK